MNQWLTRWQQVATTIKPATRYGIEGGTWVKRRFLFWFVAWATLLQGIIGVLSLGFWLPGWDLAAIDYLVRMRVRKMVEVREDDEGVEIVVTG